MSRPEPATAAATARRLAGLHLRTGLMRLARAELEQLAGEDALDADGVLDLAESRWRTGDLRGAAAAAEAWLAEGAATGSATGGSGADPRAGGLAADRSGALAHTLIAEALAARGRDEDATVHVRAALDALGEGSGGLADANFDALFAGIKPRSDAWPNLGPSGDTDQAGPAPGGVRARPDALRATGKAEPDPIAAAEERLRARDDAGAAVLLVLALRATPERAAEILGHIDGAISARPAATLLLARAEALRALGRPEAAAIAYAAAETYARRGAPGRGRAPAPQRPGPASTLAAARNSSATPDPERSSQ